MVYGGFTAHHHTQMEVFHSNLAGVQYQDEILKQRFELFVHAYQGTYQETSSQAIHQGTLSHNHLGSLSHSGLILAYLHLKKKKKSAGGDSADAAKNQIYNFFCCVVPSARHGVEENTQKCLKSFALRHIFTGSDGQDGCFSHFPLLEPGAHVLLRKLPYVTNGCMRQSDCCAGAGACPVR